MSAPLRKPSANFSALTAAAKRSAHPAFSVLHLEDFSSQLGRTNMSQSNTDAINCAYAEGRAAGFAACHDQQLDDLTQAIRRHGDALSARQADSQTETARLRNEIAQVLQAISIVLLPLTQHERLADAMIAAVREIPADLATKAIFHCPAEQVEDLRKAIALAGIETPDIRHSHTPSVQVENETARIDMDALQTRLMRLIDEYATGDLKWTESPD